MLQEVVEEIVKIRNQEAAAAESIQRSLLCLCGVLWKRGVVDAKLIVSMFDKALRHDLIEHWDVSGLKQVTTGTGKHMFPNAMLLNFGKE
jgi:methionine salvage enolase-phosphatase E1